MKAEEVLITLAEQQRSLSFLINDGRQHFADARLSVFRSDEQFAVLVEFVHFFYGLDDFVNQLCWAGNCLVEDISKAAFANQNLIQEVPDAPLWKEDEYLHWLANSAGFSIQVKGQRHDFAPSHEDYARAGIVFEEEQSGPNSIKPAELLRFVSVALNHPFFLSEEELRFLIQPEDEPQMLLLLQTDFWQHPEIILDFAEDKDLIHNIPCWQILSRAIVSSDLSEWNAQDTSKFNTDWTSLERIYRENNDGYGFS